MNDTNKNFQEQLYQIALSKIPKVGSILTKQLISYCGTVSEVFNTSPIQLRKIPGIGEELSKRIVDPSILKKAEAELQLIHSKNLKWCFYLDKEYPKRLKHFPDAPIILYYDGKINWDVNRTLAVIGTREATPEGILNCQRLISDLQEHNVCILSGLAHGIDSVAHKTAIELNMQTIGVMGNGMHYTYPAKHRSLVQKMKNNGGIISEFSYYTKPDRENFPKRNRIVAGLADATVVIESAEEGGSLITADYANQYNKDVFAFPGSVNALKSIGCNKLIKNHKASLIESAKDIEYIMGWDRKNAIKQTSLFESLSPEEEKVYHFLKISGTTEIDIIAYNLQLKSSILSSVLLQLEFKGLVNALPGKKFTVHLH